MPAGSGDELCGEGASDVRWAVAEVGGAGWRKGRRDAIARWAEDGVGAREAAGEVEQGGWRWPESR